MTFRKVTENEYYHRSVSLTLIALEREEGGALTDDRLELFCILGYGHINDSDV